MKERIEAPGWRRVAVTTTRAALAEAVFEHFGAAAISELDAGDEAAVEAAPHAQPGFELSQIVGLFPLATPVDAIRDSLLQALGATVPIEVDEVATRDWADAWVAHHPPLHCGGRLWVAPHGAQVDTHGRDDVIVRLDPGLAFGTGTHPSTALCLAWLAHADVAGRRVLDYGCGSGILAIAAAHLGAADVCAVDIDDQAVRATRANAAANGVAGRIATPAIDEPGPGGYDIVLANILARPLIELAPTLTALGRAGGRLVLAGVVQRQAESLRAAYRGRVAFSQPAQQDGWLRLDGVLETTDTD